MKSLLRSILETLVAGDILLGDAYYATCFLLCALDEKGVNGVFEQQVRGDDVRIFAVDSDWVNVII